MHKATGSYRTYSILGKAATMGPEFAVEDLLWQNCNLGSWACSEGPALKQNTLMMMMMMMMMMMNGRQPGQHVGGSEPKYKIDTVALLNEP